MGKRGKPSGGDPGGSGPSKKPRKSAGQQAPSKKGGAKPTPQIQNLHQLLPGGANHLNGRRICQNNHG